MTSELFDIDEAIEALAWDIDDAIKIQLLGYNASPISIIEKDYPVVVSKHILEHNLDSDDLPHLFGSYEKWPNEIQDVILELAVKNFASITSEPTAIAGKTRKNNTS
jgi:hypothetical protein